ncbi:MAG: hypothetical protein N2379_02940 [Verrucomicrobiae bacterium]|nr:hypothetical protein [Verrucomicrobiae bacterium]
MKLRYEPVAAFGQCWGSGCANDVFAAFNLTLRPGKAHAAAAAVLYCIGTWVSLGIFARNYFVAVLIGCGLGAPETPPIVILPWLALPVMTVAYALAAGALLWPSIPQHKAIRWGSALHTFALPLLILFVFLGTYTRFHGYFPDQLKWLVYGLMWFRVRGSYSSC